MPRHFAWLCCLVGLLLEGQVQRSLAGDPLDAATRLYRAGKYDEAVAAYTPLLPQLSGEEAIEAHLNIATSHQRRHRYQQAVDSARTVLAMKNVAGHQRGRAHLTCGYCLRMLQQSDDAMAELEAAARTEAATPHTKAEALLFLGYELNGLERFDDALTAFERVAHVKDVVPHYVATANLARGRIYQKLKQYQQAIELFSTVETGRGANQVTRSRARVYRLECQDLLAGDNPFHIKPYVSKVSTTEARIYWVSQGDTPKGQVELVSGQHKVLAEPRLSPLPDTQCRLHVAAVTGLQPGTKYAYTVRCGDARAQGDFYTAPVRADKFSFSVIGDTQSYHEGLQPLLDAMGEEDTRFVVHVGDITDRGNIWGEWRACFFDPGRPYLSRNVFWPAYGNHDGGPYFPALFELRPLYYSFDYGDLHCIVLDSYGAGSGGPGRQQQLAWLEDDLKQNQARWTIVALHVPMVATNREVDWFGKDDFLPLLERYGVDVVFSGHHPHYRRYRPLGSPSNRPILHITSGGGGGPVGGNMPSPLLSTGVNVNHYCVVTVDGDSLTIVAKAISGAIIDRFTLRKDGQDFQKEVLTSAVDTQRAKQIISLYQELLTDETYRLKLHAAAGAEAGQPATLTLDLARLPRGPLDTQNLPDDARLHVRAAEDSPWNLPPQSFLLKDGRGDLEAVAPASLATSGTALSPSFDIELTLEAFGQKYEAVTVQADVLAPSKP